MVKSIFFLFVLLCGVFLGGGYFLPEHVVVSRSTVMAAKPEQVFPYLSDLRKFREWSPWSKVDPKMQVAFTGEDGKVGQTLSWVSEKREVGKGVQRIEKIVPNKRVDISVTLEGKGKSMPSFFEVAPLNGGVEVVWSFEQTNKSLFEKWLSFLIIKRAIGEKYEEGLQDLRKIVEKESVSLNPSSKEVSPAP